MAFLFIMAAVFAVHCFCEVAGNTIAAGYELALDYGLVVLEPYRRKADS